MPLTPFPATFLVTLLGLHSLLTLLPICSGVMGGRLLGVRGPLGLLVCGLCALGVGGYLTFWAYYLSPSLGAAVALTLKAASVIAVAAFWVMQARRRPPAWREVIELAVPFILVVLVASFVAAVGFDRGGANQPLAVASVRFSHQLPDDNALPFVLARDLETPKRPLPHPMSGDWLTSDRPPLQAGTYLLEVGGLGITDKEGAHYQVAGILLQCLWLVGMWALLVTLRLERKVVALILVACIFSGFVIVNTFFVWPKLITAAFLLPLGAIAMTSRTTLGCRTVGAGALAGLAAALAMLAHGGSVFALIAIAATALLRRRVPSLRFVAAAAAVLVLGQASWATYQRFVDPPGNKLLKLQLAGSPANDNRSLTTTIEDGYSSIGLAKVIDLKRDNVEALYGSPGQLASSAASVLTKLNASSAAQVSARTAAADVAREATFFHLLLCSGSLGIAGGLSAVALCYRRVRSKAEARLALDAFTCVALGVLVWCVILFGPPNAGTVVHQGTYMIPLLFTASSTLMVWAVHRWLAYLLVGLNVLWTLILYCSLVPSNFAMLLPVSHELVGLAVLTALGISVVLAFIALNGRSLSVQPVAAPRTRRSAGSPFVHHGLSEASPEPTAEAQRQVTTKGSSSGNEPGQSQGNGRR